MATGDVKILKENSGGTHDEDTLTPSDIGAVSSTEVTIIKQLTAAQYAALSPPVSTTLYIIVG